MQFNTEAEIRDFLRLCLAPRPGINRTPAKLAEIMPGPLFDALVRYAPHLRELQQEADRRETEARTARRAYAHALAEWIEGDSTTYLCPQNRSGGKREQGAHHYGPSTDTALSRCLFCSALNPDETETAYLTPDGRVWTLAAEVNNDLVPLYEAPFVDTRYTALGLETLHGEITPCSGRPAPAYVLNADSVNSSPETTVKHLLNGLGTTRCPRAFRASKPLTDEEAAEYSLCGGCRTALLSDARP
ncbi:hypothetical protein [Streptomyces parvulus]|uniref:hypothetical protein n=1 Tax=Streptomyces parvulus TaxID=146923 RepID=UPI0037FA6565